MDDRLKIGAAVVGGYVLGRTKKGRAAIRLAMWLAGNDYRPSDLVRTGALRVGQSAEATKLIQQLRGPVMLAAQGAAQAAVEAQVGRLTQGIQRRTESITGAARPATDSEAVEQPEDVERREATEEQPEEPQPEAEDEREEPQAEGQEPQTEEEPEEPAAAAEESAEEPEEPEAETEEFEGEEEPEEPEAEAEEPAEEPEEPEAKAEEPEEEEEPGEPRPETRRQPSRPRERRAPRPSR